MEDPSERSGRLKNTHPKLIGSDLEHGNIIMEDLLFQSLLDSSWQPYACLAMLIRKLLPIPKACTTSSSARVWNGSNEEEEIG
jgi:hypothetical protein